MNDREEVVWCRQVIRLTDLLFFSLRLTHTQAQRALCCSSVMACFAGEEIWNTLRHLLAVACVGTPASTPHPPHAAEVWLIKDEFGGEGDPHTGKQEKGWKTEGEMKGWGHGPLWSLQNHTVNGLFTQRGMEGRRTRSERKKENSHILQCLMPVARLCNYSPLSLAPSGSFIPPPFPSAPLFALFLLICANHHETTSTLEPLTGPAWHPDLSKHITAASVLCAWCSSYTDIWGTFHPCGGRWQLIWLWTGKMIYYPLFSTISHHPVLIWTLSSLTCSGLLNVVSWPWQTRSHAHVESLRLVGEAARVSFTPTRELGLASSTTPAVIAPLSLRLSVHLSIFRFPLFTILVHRGAFRWQSLKVNYEHQLDTPYRLLFLEVW